MKVLAMDTATKAATVAVTEDGKLLGEVTLNLNKPHSQKVMPLIEGLLSELELKPSDIDLFACANGPGSFTGLRIGVAAVQGLATSVGKKCAGVSTLEAMAANFTQITDACVCPLLDAKREQAYYALYKGDKEIIAPSLETVDNVLNQIACLNKPVLFVGDAVPVYADKIKAIIPEAKLAPDVFNVNFAYHVAILAQNKVEKELPSAANPEYLMKSYVDKE
ncbi:MAG: tRNA (adenosine(37)-N6)-threonylcarbamoyltransferase complex dimerization subunit type 1 TsaB [Clostridia bacterium]|nr:tRNA (adenosine(37)-N6)-threonylcarbamoyltransferase complex dimerization subunit type 1 TsaB [Clostridia bacterium]